MMSFALMGCMIFSASDAMAQGRSRSQGGSSSSRSQSAAVSRSSSSTAPTVSRSSQATPQVNRGSSSMSTGRATVNRSVSGNRSSEVRPRTTTGTRSSTTTPQVTTRTTPDRSTVGQGTRTGGTRVGTGVTTRGGNNGTTGGSHVGNGTNPRGGNSSTTSGNGTTMNRRSDIGSTRVSTDKGKLDPTDRSTTTVTTRQGDKNRPSSRPGGNNGGKPGGNNGNHGGKPGGDNGKPGGNNGNHGGDNGKPGGNHGNHGGKPGGSGNNHGYGSHNHYDYSHHPHGNAFHHNYTHHSWSRPLPPPARPHRPAPIIWRRPVIPVGWHPYAGAPVIDRILGLMFGSLYEASLDHLYYNGYYIDGYADNVIYLRDVSMLNLYWPDVMLSYEYGRLANAQFIYHSSYYDRVRFDRVYNSLCRIYGSPVFDDGMTVSWYGGNSTGWVTLTMTDSYGDYYTTMSIGY